MKNDTKRIPNPDEGRTFLPSFSRPFPKIDFWMHFGRPLAPFWLPLAPFWLPLAIFWLPFGTIWRTFALHFLTLESPSVIFYISIRNQTPRTSPIIWPSTFWRFSVLPFWLQYSDCLLTKQDTWCRHSIWKMISTSRRIF